jgi:(R,R)-butanediol dehydrogenase/meso-butanediol dehydrogenase/diacetyl reductase
MKAARWTGIDTIELGSIPEPSPGEGEVMVEVRATGICGTDLTIYHGAFPPERARPPLVLGHEFSGTVAEIGKGVTGLKKEDPVVVDPLISCGTCYSCTEGFPHLCATLKLLGIDVNGSFAQYVTASASRTYPMPREMSFVEGALVEPLSVAVHAVRRSALGVGDRALVIGGGPIGMLIALVCRSAGARTLVVTEMQEYRLEILEELGIQGHNPRTGKTGELVSRFFDGIGPDIAFEATGTSAGMQQAIECVRYRGTVVEVGLPKGRTENDTRRVVFGEISLVGSRVYAPVDIRTSIDLLGGRRIDVEPLVKTYPLDACPRLFETLSRGEGNLMKAVFLLRE